MIFASSYEDYPLELYLACNNFKVTTTEKSSDANQGREPEQEPDPESDDFQDKDDDARQFNDQRNRQLAKYQSSNVLENLKLRQHTMRYDTLMRTIFAMPNFVMEEVVRSKSSNVLGICTKIRNWTLGNTEKYNIKKFINTNECCAYKYTPPTSKTKTDWFAKFVLMCTQSNDAIILTWTNKQCDEYNNAIRQKIFGTNTLARFQVNDILMLGDFYSMPDKEEKKPLKDDTPTSIANNSNAFYTSEQIKVIKIEIVNRKIESLPTTLPTKAINLENGNIYNTQYKKVVAEISSHVGKFYKCWKLAVTRLANNTNEISTIYVVHEDNLELYNMDISRISEIIRKLRTSLCARFHSKSVTIDNNVIKPIWKDFNDIYVQPFANVNYGYCITCHKGQGSTFYNVFVDINDIVKNGNTNEMKRCMYTAISRTSNELHMLI